MPRKSAAARTTPLLTERSRLQPPSGLSTRERQLFREVVGSVKPEHFAAEDSPMIALYARALAQTEMAAREITSGSNDRFWIELQTSALKTVNTMAVRLRLGPLSRSPHNQCKPQGTAQSGLPLPWEGNRMLRGVARDDSDGKGERRFSDLLAQTRGRRGADRASPRRDIATLAATEAADIAAFVSASTTCGTLAAT